MDANGPTPARRGGKYLALRIAREEFAIDARLVRGILRIRECDVVPEPSSGLVQYFGPWICGFATLRGADIPVIDLGAKLRLPHAKRPRNGCIVVIEAKTPEGPRMVGFLADRVARVMDVRERDLVGGKVRIQGRFRRLIQPEMLTGNQ